MTPVIYTLGDDVELHVDLNTLKALYALLENKSGETLTSRLSRGPFGRSLTNKATCALRLSNLKDAIKTLFVDEGVLPLGSETSEKIVSFTYPSSDYPYNRVRRVVRVTEEDDYYVSGVDLQKEGFRKYLRSKMREFKVVSN